MGRGAPKLVPFSYIGASYLVHVHVNVNWVKPDQHLKCVLANISTNTFMYIKWVQYLSREHSPDLCIVASLSRIMHKYYFMLRSQRFVRTIILYESPFYHCLKIVRTAFVAVRNGICDRGFRQPHRPV